MTALARERLLATQQAESAHAWLLRAVEAMSEAVAFFDQDDRLVLWNRKYAEIISGRDEVLAVGADFDSVLGALLATALEADQRSVGESEPTCLDGADRHVRLADGRWFQLDDRPLPEGGRAIVAVDITELKVREESFRLMFDANPVAMVVYDRQTHQVLHANQSALAQFARSYDELAASKITDFMLAEDRAAALRRLERPGEGGPPPTYSIVDGQNRIRQIQPYQRPLRFRGRDCLLCAAVDVTARKAASDALAKARDAAEAANRAKSEFLANMSHEIRTPLNGVLGVAGALRRSQLSDRQIEMVRVIEDSAESLQVLLADILDLARVEAGRLEISPRPFDMREMVSNVAELFKPKAEEKGLSLGVHLDLEPDAHFVGDAIRIKQILGNLLSNAVKFTASGSISLDVSLGPLEGGHRQARFEVRDTGIGFDHTVRDRLFSRFAQADGSITRKFGGSGLGLAISRALAGLMGGDISAQSELGHGATFVLELPLAVAETRRPKAAAAESRGIEPNPQGAPLRILAAEDHEVNRKVLQLMFENMAVDLTLVGNGREAVERFDADRFDLILMDMQMPEVDGLQAVAAIRAREGAAGLERTPIIMLTANALPEHEAAGRAAGADAFLSKPVSVQKLMTTVQATLEKVTQARAA
jgi:PAS domain S-box-containing protein